MYNYFAFIFFVCSCFFVRCLYFVVHLFLSVMANKYIQLPEYRRLYVQKNIIKSTVLALMLPPVVIMVVFPIWNQNVWHTNTIHFFAAVYGSNDFVGLLCVDRLPKTTLIHHVISTFMVLTSFSMDFQTSPMAQSMLVYTFFAASSYIVNFHLATRWLFPRDDKRWLRYLSCGIYALTCGLSWFWQLRWIWNTALEWYHFVYIGLMMWIVRDDIILMRWLTTI